MDGGTRNRGSERKHFADGWCLVWPWQFSHTAWQRYSAHSERHDPICSGGRRRSAVPERKFAGHAAADMQPIENAWGFMKVTSLGQTTSLRLTIFARLSKKSGPSWVQKRSHRSSSRSLVEWLSASLQVVATLTTSGFALARSTFATHDFRCFFSLIFFFKTATSRPPPAPVPHCFFF